MEPVTAPLHVISFSVSPGRGTHRADAPRTMCELSVSILGRKKRGSPREGPEWGSFLTSFCTGSKVEGLPLLPEPTRVPSLPSCVPIRGRLVHMCCLNLHPSLLGTWTGAWLVSRGRGLPKGLQWDPGILTARQRS